MGIRSYYSTTGTITSYTIQQQQPTAAAAMVLQQIIFNKISHRI